MYWKLDIKVTIFLFIAMLLSPSNTLLSSAYAQSRIEGVWDTSEGRITLERRGRSVTGRYTSDNGEIVGRIKGNVLEGHWIEDGSAKKCDQPKNGRFHWGRIVYTFDGDAFKGVWSYCEDEPKSAWTGKRAASSDTTVSAGVSAAVSVGGNWDTSEGKMTLTQAGASISGRYTSDNGEIVGTLQGKVLTGYWIEDGSAKKCDQPKNGRFHWGRIVYTFDGDAFKGVWSYCEDEPKSAWTGRRTP